MITAAQAKAACERMKKAHTRCLDAIAELTIAGDEDGADSQANDELIARQSVLMAAKLLQEALRRRGGV